MDQNSSDLHSSISYCTCDMDGLTQEKKKDEKNSKRIRKQCRERKITLKILQRLFIRKIAGKL